MSSKASRLLGIEKSDQASPRSPTSQLPQSARSIFGFSTNRKKSVATKPKARSSLKTVQHVDGLEQIDLDLDASDSDAQLDTGVKRRPTGHRDSIGRDAAAAAAALEDRLRSTSMSSQKSSSSHRLISNADTFHSTGPYASGKHLLDTEKIPPRRKSSAAPPPPIDLPRLHSDGYPSPTLPQLGTASLDTMTFSDAVMQDIPSSYTTTSAGPSSDTTTKHTTTASEKALQRLSIISIPPTPPPKDTPPALSPSASSSTRTSRILLAPIPPNITNTFLSTTSSQPHIYTHGPIRLKSTDRRSISLNTVAGWSLDDEDAGLSLYSNTEELVALVTATQLSDFYNKLYGTDDDVAVMEIWSKEWLAAPVLDVALVNGCAARQREIAAEEGGVKNDYPGHRRNVSSGSGMGSGSVRFSRATTASRFSAGSVLSVESAGTGAGGTPVRKSWDRKTGSGIKTQEGLKDLWFRRGLF